MGNIDNLVLGKAGKPRSVWASWFAFCSRNFHFPFETQIACDTVSFNTKTDFTIEANDTLFDMVLVNLLKNGMRAILRRGKGNLTFVVDKTANTGCT